MVPIVGVAHIGYIPRKRVVGIVNYLISNLFGKRLQTGNYDCTDCRYY